MQWNIAYIATHSINDVMGCNFQTYLFHFTVQNCGGGGDGAGSGEISRGGGDEEGIHVMFGDGIY